MAKKLKKGLRKARCVNRWIKRHAKVGKGQRRKLLPRARRACGVKGARSRRR